MSNSAEGALAVGSAVVIRSNEKADVFHPYRPDAAEQARTDAFRARFGFGFAAEIGARTHAGIQRRLHEGERGRITAVISNKDNLMYWVRLGNGPDEVRLYPRQVTEIVI